MKQSVGNSPPGPGEIVGKQRGGRQGDFPNARLKVKMSGRVSFVWDFTVRKGRGL